MAVKVVARGEASRERLRKKGITPGKISSGSVSRSSSGTKTTRSASGEVEKVEEPVTLEDGSKAVKVTTYDDKELQNNREQQQEKFYDDSGRQLSPYEAYAVTSRGGGMSRYKPGTFSQEGESVYITTSRMKSELSSTNLSAYKTLGTINKGVGLLNERSKVDADIQEAVAAGDEEKLRALQKKRRELQKNDFATSNPSYGLYQPLKEEEKASFKRVSQQAAGIFSKGFTTIGERGKTFFQDRRERLQARNVYSGGSRDDKLGVSNVYELRESGVKALNVAEGGFGFVETVGRDKKTAIFTAATIPAGALFRGAKIVAGPAVSSALSKAPASVNWALKGSGKGLKAGIVGFLGAEVTTSDEPFIKAGEVGAGVFAASKGFKIGTSAADDVARSTAAARTSYLQRTLSGKALTQSQARKVARSATIAGKTPVGRPVKGFKAQAVQTTKDGKLLTTEKYDLTLGAKSRLTPKGYDALKVDYQAARAGIAQGRNIQGTNLRPSQLVMTKEAGSGVIRTQDFNKLIGSRSGGVIVETGKASSDSIKLFAVKGKVTGIDFPRAYAYKPAPKRLGVAQIQSNTNTLPVYDPFDIRVYDSSRGAVFFARNRIGSEPFIFSGFKTGEGLNNFYKPVTPTTTASASSFVVVSEGLVQEVRNAPQQTLKTETKTETQTKELGGQATGRTVFSEPPSDSAPQNSFFEELTVSLTKPAQRFNQETTGPSASKQGSTIRDRFVPIVSGSSVNYDRVNFDTAGTSDTSSSSFSSISSSSSSSRSTVDSGESTAAMETSSTSSETLSSNKPPAPTINNPFTPSTPQRAPRDKPPAFFVGFKRIRSENLFTPGYDVEARIGGIFKRISRSPLSLKEAVGFGSSVVGSSPAASFRVSKSSQPATGRFFGSSMIGDFDRRPGGLFVEKREKRINTLGELVGITRKGQAAIKNKGIFGK